MIPKHNTPLEYLLEGMVQRKLHFNEDEFRQLLFERACQEIELDDLSLKRELINTKMCRYATDVLLTLDDIYIKQDIDLYLAKDADGNYWVTDNDNK